MVAVDNAGQEVAKGLPGPGLCDSHHVLHRRTLDCFPLVFFGKLCISVYNFAVFVLDFVCLFFVWLIVCLFVCLFTCPVRARGQPCDWIGVGSAYPACLERNTD